MVAVTAKLDLRQLQAAFTTFSATEKKAILDKIVRTDAQGFVRDVIAITPPGSQGNPLKQGGGAEKAGKVKIYRDLMKIFAPLSDRIISSVKQDGDSTLYLFSHDGKKYFCQQGTFKPSVSLGDMEAHHSQHWKKGRIMRIKDLESGKSVTFRRMVIPLWSFDEFKTYLYKRIGMLAGGWMDAVKKLKVRNIPKIVTRHPSGSAEIITKSDGFVVKIANDVPYASEADMVRRSEWVLDSNKRAARMAKRIEVEIAATLKKKLK